MRTMKDATSFGSFPVPFDDGASAPTAGTSTLSMRRLKSLRGADDDEDAATVALRMPIAAVAGRFVSSASSSAATGFVAALGERTIALMRSRSRARMTDGFGDEVTRPSPPITLVTYVGAAGAWGEEAIGSGATASTGSAVGEGAD